MKKSFAMIKHSKFLICLLMVLLGLLITTSALMAEPITVFNDGFTSMNNWTVTGGNENYKWHIYNNEARTIYNATESQMTQNTAVNVSGIVTLKFGRELVGTTTKYLKVDVYDGDEWIEVYSTSATTGMSTVTLDVSAYANAAFKVKFRGKANGAFIYVDNVYIINEITAPPEAFNLTGPANGATGVSVTPTLSWSASGGATSYDVYYGTTSPGMLQANVTGTSYTVPVALANNTTYYWKVVAKNAAGETTATGAPRSFTTEQMPVPGVFSLTSPANGATGVAVTPTLTWTASSGAASYDVYYGTTSPGTLQTNVTGTSYTVPEALTISTVYYWKIVAKNAGGETTATGAPRSFTTVEMSAPGAFELTSPASGVTGVSAAPTLSWSAASEAASYDVYYGTISPGTLQANVTGTSFTVNVPLNSGVTYYWKVVAKNPGGETTATGVPWSFTTMESELPATVYYYDTLERLIKTKQIIDGVSYITETAYDDLDRPVVVTYPDGSQVHYTYNGYNGSVTKIGSTAGGDQYLKGLVYDQYGMIVSKTLGNDVTLNYIYDPDNFRLNRVTANNNLP